MIGITDIALEHQLESANEFGFFLFPQYPDLYPDDIAQDLVLKEKSKLCYNLHRRGVSCKCF